MNTGYEDFDHVALWLSKNMKAFDGSDLSPERAKAEFANTIAWLKRVTAEKMKTKEGRDDIRRTFGCKIEGFEDEQ